jgi:imidazolonepropionase-like amidohydrolase
LTAQLQCEIVLLENEQFHWLRLQLEVAGVLATLRSATSVNAELIDCRDLGRIEVGAAADLVILNGDPFAEPSILWAGRESRTVIQAGVPIRQDRDR